MKTLIKAKKIGAIITTILLISLFSCTGTHQDKEESKKLSASESKDSFPYPGIVFLLPSPSEVLLITFQNDIAYNPSLVAPNDLDKKAIISQQQALILGVYIADLSYNILFRDHPAGINNLNSIQKLSQNLGIGALLYDRYFKRIENNISVIDSMDAIFNDFSENSFNTLEATGNNELLSLIAMGSGIEAMYISYKSIGLEKINNTILPNFQGQKVIYENYYKNFMNYNYNKPELKNFLHDIKRIYNLFELNVAVKNYSTVSEIKNSHFSIHDRTVTPPYDEKGIRELGDSIVIVRNNLISLKYQ